MKISKLTLAVATVLGASATTGAFAMDLYVDTKTNRFMQSLVVVASLWAPLKRSTKLLRK